MITLIATLIVWAIIQAFCNKNPVPLAVFLFLYIFLKLISMLNF